ncbi:hemolysin III [Roseovarius sp. TE539]|nr:hemolysin III [Roseovarius sp. TE539]
MSYPAYTRAERIADGTIQVIGFLGAITGICLLFTVVSLDLNGPLLTAVIVYAAGLLVMLAASAAYHLAAHTPARPYLRRLDHAAIYLKIASTFTPLSVILGTAFGYAVLACVWVLAIFGATVKLFKKRGKMTTGWAPYLALGWIGVVLFIPLTAVLPGFSLAFIIAGGFLYTAGIAFYIREKLRFSNAIWHGFTLAASACFFLGISGALPAAP